MFGNGAFAVAAASAVLAAGPTTTFADTMKGDAMKGSVMSVDCKNADALMMKAAHSAAGREKSGRAQNPLQRASFASGAFLNKPANSESLTRTADSGNRHPPWVLSLTATG